MQRVHLVDPHAVEQRRRRPRCASSTPTGSPLASGTMMSAPGPMWSSTASAVVGSWAESIVGVARVRRWGCGEQLGRRRALVAEAEFARDLVGPVACRCPVGPGHLRRRRDHRRSHRSRPAAAAMSAWGSGSITGTLPPGCGWPAGALLDPGRGRLPSRPWQAYGSWTSPSGSTA